jgi:kynurenine formamidase
VVIDVHEQTAADSNYHATVDDVEGWEAKHGRIPKSAVVMFRPDWYKKWDDAENFANVPFPGVKLDTLKFLHLERKILLHGHEAFDSDSTPTLAGEYWLMHNNFAQEGVANLTQAPESWGAHCDRFRQTERRGRRLCPVHRDRAGRLAIRRLGDRRTGRATP